MLHFVDNKWFFEGINSFIKAKLFFVISPQHLSVAKTTCSRDTYYMIKHYDNDICIFRFPSENTEINEKRLTWFEAVVSPKVTDEQLIEKFENEELCACVTYDAV